jgi:hypothetical protein
MTGVAIVCVLGALGRDYKLPQAKLEAWLTEWCTMENRDPDHLLQMLQRDLAQ